MSQENQTNVPLAQNPIQKLSQKARFFYQFHGVQMIGSDFPPHLIQKLYQKLTNQVYDGGQNLKVTDNEDQQRYDVNAIHDLSKKGDVFILDHALTFRYPELRKNLKQNPQIIERLQNMLKYHQKQKQLKNQTVEQEVKYSQSLQLQDMSMTDLQGIELPKTLVTLSLMNNSIENQDAIISKIKQLTLKVLWLNGNPVEQNEQLRQYINKKTRIQIYNSKFTPNCTLWGIKYAHSKNVNYSNETDNNDFIHLNLDNRNIFNIDTELLKSFRNLKVLSLRGHEINSQNISKFQFIFSLQKLHLLYLDQEAEKIVRSNEEFSKKIIEKGILINKHSLKQQLYDGDLRIDQIINCIFRIAGNYRLASSQKLDESSCWYINDELGSYIPHSDNPNVKIIPFLFAPENKLDENLVSYSLLWATEQIKSGELITRDYLNGLKQQRQRSSRLAAWYKLPQSYYSKQIQDHNKKMFELQKNSVMILQKFYTINAAKQKQYAMKLQYSDKKRRVITDYEYINKYLKHESFELVNQLQKADIIWLLSAAEQQEWNKYKGNYHLNQFPFESCIVQKHNLASTIQTVLGNTKFLMRTYDLEKQLSVFVGDYYKRQKQGHNNLWIIKPNNMARSLDMIITDNLPLIIRNMETGPKIAQQYILSPVLRRGRKVDLRYILLVKSISPLTLFLYKHFWIRSANNQYTLDRRHLSTYETQFTVMNYTATKLEQIKYKDFIEQFEKDYKVNWSSINDKIKKMLRNVFIAVGQKHPEMHDDKSRAAYGIDIMIDSETMQPKLLQITFSPDCKRACQYYPTFYDEIFQTLFTEFPSQNMQRII